MRRRELILGLSALVALRLFAREAAQGARAAGDAPAVIGLLAPFTRADTELWHRAFRQGLHDLGWVEGGNIRFEYRYADGQVDRLPELVAELINLKVDVIVTAVTPDALAAAKATKTIPIVMAATGDPVTTGLIASLARPGGNVTGLTQIQTDLSAKRLQLLKEIAPGISRIAALWNPQDAISSLARQEIESAARHLAVELHSLEVRSSDELTTAFASAADAHDDALMVLPSPIFVVNEQRIADFAAKHRLPSMFHLREFVQAGGLLAYGPDRADLFRRAASYVDKILKGANPADLPVKQPTKFQLVINLTTAKALGLTVPRYLLAEADEIIE
jgi:putative tryptophan/tyrosine transport system substrate-binding protein